MENLVYDGKVLHWGNALKFKATSGMPGYQDTRHQCVAEKGPVPAGNYYIALILGNKAEDDGEGICRLRPSWQIQEIPRGSDAGECEPYWANWGYNRVRFEPADTVTKSKCYPNRSGFYLHDSTKGFSHGCIEVEQSFFGHLREHAKNSGNKRLSLTIEYSGTSTNGGTKIAP